MDQAAPRCQDLLHSGAVLGSPLRWGQAGFPVPPRSQSGTKDPPTVSRVSRSCPKCGDRGQPSCVIKLMWVCPAGHWGGQCGDAPSPGDVGFPATTGNLCLWAGGFLLNYFKLEKKKKNLITKYGALGLWVAWRGWGGGHDNWPGGRDMPQPQGHGAAGGCGSWGQV